MMKYFSPDFLEFFKELAANNHKDWFDENRKRYHKEIKEPFKIFVGDLIQEIKTNYEPQLLIEPKDAIFRINRDIRFSKDKTPYKTNLSALLSPKGRKNHSYPSLYLELGPEKIGIYGGCYGFSTQELALMRKHIFSNHKTFISLLASAEFKGHYPNGIEGEKHKRPAKEYKEFVEKEPLILNKQLYYYSHLDPALIPTDKLMPTILEYYKASFELMQFLRIPLD